LRILGSHRVKREAQKETAGSNGGATAP